MEQKELADGTKKFDDEGIKKLSDLAEDDLQDLMDRLMRSVPMTMLTLPSVENPPAWMEMSSL